MPYPHDPGILDAPTTATESGANKYCQWLCLIRVVSGKLSKIPHLGGPYRTIGRTYKLVINIVDFNDFARS